MKMNPGGVRYCPSPPVWWFGHPAIGSAEFTVLMVLLLHSDKRGSCFVGQKTAANYFRKSRAWANAAISRLVLQLHILQDQILVGSSLVVAGFGNGLMDAAPQRPLQDVIKAEADGQLEAGDESANLRHTEGNW